MFLSNIYAIPDSDRKICIQVDDKIKCLSNITGNCIKSL